MYEDFVRVCAVVCNHTCTAMHAFACHITMHFFSHSGVKNEFKFYACMHVFMNIFVYLRSFIK